MTRRMRAFAVGIATLGIVSLSAFPASAANPYNAVGYMNYVGDYAGVKVQNAGAGVIAVRATIIYQPPSSGGSTYETSTFKDTTVEANIPVTTGTPTYGIAYSQVTKFKGCSGSGTSCTLSSTWDGNGATHVFT
ncbi:MAG: hypothetical protein DIU73_009160 [Actinomycetes bacterium]